LGPDPNAIWLINLAPPSLYKCILYEKFEAPLPKGELELAVNSENAGRPLGAHSSLSMASAAAAAPPAGGIPVKMVCNNEMRRFTLQAMTFQSLCTEIRKILGIPNDGMWMYLLTRREIGQKPRPAPTSAIINHTA